MRFPRRNDFVCPRTLGSRVDRASIAMRCRLPHCAPSADVWNDDTERLVPDRSLWTSTCSRARRRTSAGVWRAADIHRSQFDVNKKLRLLSVIRIIMTWHVFRRRRPAASNAESSSIVRNARVNQHTSCSFYLFFHFGIAAFSSVPTQKP